MENLKSFSVIHIACDTVSETTIEDGKSLPAQELPDVELAYLRFAGCDVHIPGKHVVPPELLHRK